MEVSRTSNICIVVRRKVAKVMMTMMMRKRRLHLAAAQAKVEAARSQKSKLAKAMKGLPMGSTPMGSARKHRKNVIFEFWSEFVFFGPGEVGIV